MKWHSANEFPECSRQNPLNNTYIEGENLLESNKSSLLNAGICFFRIT